MAKTVAGCGGAYPVPMEREIAIREDVIRLGQLLKLSGLADSGTEARALLQEGDVTVNGKAEMRRGRQLHRGDLVRLGDEAVRVV